MPSVSVVIPTFNCAQYLPNAIDSVLSQSVSPTEVIVIDDGSKDDTESVMRSYRDVRYIRQENAGPAKARNTGVKAARGDFVAFLDADDFWLAKKLETQMAAFERFPNAGFCFSVPWNFSDAGDNKVPDQPYAPRVLEMWLNKQDLDGEAAFGSAYSLLLNNNCVATSSVVARTDAILSLGLFDETMRGYEDYDMWLRLARTYPVIFIRNPVSRYRVQSGGLSGTWESRSELFYNYCIRVVEKELCTQRTHAARRSLADYYSAYAYFLLCRNRRPQAMQIAIKSLGVLPNWKSGRVLLESAFPSLFSTLAALLRKSRELICER